MTRREAFDFISARKLAVLASVSMYYQPEAALVGIAVTEDLEIIFDTLKTSRKYRNLSASSSAALVIGLEGEVTLQYEGIARESSPAELERYRPVYFAAFPDGLDRAARPDIAYFIVRPTWIRYSDYRAEPERIEMVDL